MRFTVEPISLAEITIGRLAEYCVRQFRRLGWALYAPEPYWDDVVTDLATVTPNAAQTPTWTKITDDGSGSTGVYSWLWGTTLEESLDFGVEMPHARKLGTDLRPHVHFSPNGNTAGVIVWGLEYIGTNINGTRAANSTIIYAELSVPANSQGDHLVAGFTEIDGSDIGMSHDMQCRLFRALSHPNHTLTDDVFASKFDIHILKDVLGSELEYVKRVEG